MARLEVATDPRTEGSAEPEFGGERSPVDRSSGLADAVDDLIDRFDRMRDRPTVSLGLLAVAVVVGGGLWWRQSRAAGPAIDDLLPMVEAADERWTGPSAAAAQPPVGDRAPDTGDAAGPVSVPASTDPADRVDRLDPAAETVVVHVVGAVRRPGLVELAGGGRVADAVAGAGGPTTGADLHRLNLAEPLVDGMRIRVPVLEPLDSDSDNGNGNGNGSESGAGDSGAGTEPLLTYPESRVGVDTGPGGPDGSSGRPVDLNTADAARLDTLPGIGPAIAGAIVDWRLEHGPFRTVDDLLSVPGIGTAKLAALRDRVVV